MGAPLPIPPIRKDGFTDQGVAWARNCLSRSCRPTSKLQPTVAGVIMNRLKRSVGQTNDTADNADARE